MESATGIMLIKLYVCNIGASVPSNLAISGVFIYCNTDSHFLVSGILPAKTLALPHGSFAK